MFTDCSIETHFPSIASLTGDALLHYKKNCVQWMMVSKSYKSEVYDYIPDPANVIGCVLCVTTGICGELTTVRYPKHELVKLPENYISKYPHKYAVSL